MLGKFNQRPHIVLIVSRGEAVRNFLYSDTLPTLSKDAQVTLLSVIDDERFNARFRPYVEQIIPLRQYRERRLVTTLRHMLHEAHFRWLWSKVAQNVWEIRAEKARTAYQKVRWAFFRSWARVLANRPALETLTELERYLTWLLRPNDDFITLFKELQPNLVFNCSHIHGQAGELPVKIAHRLGIPTAGFIFSWDNLTSRSRILVPYDYYFVWHERMKQQLLSIYPKIAPEKVFVTGTPQFDFHFKPEFHLSRKELAQRIGIDPKRPFVFYTTGIAKHFPEEHHHVELIADVLQEIDISQRPQLVVRTYVKGTSQEMNALAARNLPDVIFPPVLWDEKWATPLYEDLAIFTSCLHHAAMGINAASTVSLELLMFDKPVLNIGFDPPGSQIPHSFRWIRHITFDHYQPVVDSRAVDVAYSPDDISILVYRSLTQSTVNSAARQLLISHMFGGTLDGCAGVRVAMCLLQLALKSVKTRSRKSVG